MMSWLPFVMPAPISRSSSRSSTAMMPLVRVPRERRERRLLDGTVLGDQEHELVFLERLAPGKTVH